MVVFACKELPELEDRHHQGESWYCGHLGLGVCKKVDKVGITENIVYAWALNADGLKLPKG